MHFWERTDPSTDRQLSQAQAAYEAVIALRPDKSQKMIVMNNLEPQPILELASLNLALLRIETSPPLWLTINSPVSSPAGGQRSR